MRLSKSFVPTLKDVDRDVQMPSHKLMLRAGMVRQLAAGVFSWLPVGLRVLRKIEAIVREEQNRIGAQEFLLPGLNPKEIWEETGRVEAMGEVLMHIKNNDGLVLAPTHEEVITYHARQHIASYKEMPQMWYQIQTKYRYEARPKSGVLRGRQFIMKDAYSLDATEDGLNNSYESQKQAYIKIFDRCGLDYFIVGASSGAMGGSGSQEFMVPNENGEDTCAYVPGGYAANLEVAVSDVEKTENPADNPEAKKFATPNAKTITELAEQFGLDERYCVKSLVYLVEGKGHLVLMRGVDEANDTKLEAAFGTDKFRPATSEELVGLTGANAGSIGPVGIEDMPVIADDLLEGRIGLYCGANEDGYHLKNVSLERDCGEIRFVNLRTVKAGERDIESGKALIITNAIETGHIFKLGTRYSEAMGAKFLDQNGKEKPIIMGSYGIGMERIMACFIEQNHDEKGIVWNKALTPFDFHIITIGADKDKAVEELADTTYNSLQHSGYSVLYDDRKASPGFKFKDSELIGVPIHIVIGSKSLQKGEVEVKLRKSGESKVLPVDDLMEGIIDSYNKLED
jgi:prolyl-tRNA synthetase